MHKSSRNISSFFILLATVVLPHASRAQAVTGDRRAYCSGAMQVLVGESRPAPNMAAVATRVHFENLAETQAVNTQKFKASESYELAQREALENHERGDLNAVAQAARNFLYDVDKSFRYIQLLEEEVVAKAHWLKLDRRQALELVLKDWEARFLLDSDLMLLKLPRSDNGLARRIQWNLLMRETQAETSILRAVANGEGHGDFFATLSRDYEAQEIIFNSADEGFASTAFTWSQRAYFNGIIDE